MYIATLLHIYIATEPLAFEKVDIPGRGVGFKLSTLGMWHYQAILLTQLIQGRNHTTRTH